MISCSQKPTELVGVWEVRTPYHKALYSIEEYKSNIVGRVLYYNDNTFTYRESGTEKDIFLHEIKQKKGVYIDASSGATITHQEYIIKQTHIDTLEVTKLIHNKPLKELWIKQ